MWGLCMLNFRPLASLVWEENEVANACMASRPIPIQNFKIPPFASGGVIPDKIVCLFKKNCKAYAKKNKTHCMPTFRCIHPLSVVSPPVYSWHTGIHVPMVQILS